VTEYAVKHKLVRKINFTGSDRVGKIIAGWAASCLKQTLLELGGKAPVVVLEDADLKDAVDAILFGALSNSGQICMSVEPLSKPLSNIKYPTAHRIQDQKELIFLCPNRSTERVIIHKTVAEEFTSLLLNRIREIKAGNHLEDPSVSLSGLYCSAAPKRILSLIDDALANGAKLLFGDRTITGPNKTILQPHVIDSVTPSMSIFREESFGPILCITRAASEQEAIDLANDSEYSLCASIFTKDVLRGMELARQIRAGSCHVNGPTVYIEPTLPNGGTGGRSGYGRFGGMAGVEEFTERKIISLVKPGMKYPL
jgi:benzaldehyde dehydrogenase (NAD)